MSYVSSEALGMRSVSHKVAEVVPVSSEGRDYFRAFTDGSFMDIHEQPCLTLFVPLIRYTPQGRLRDPTKNRMHPRTRGNKTILDDGLTSSGGTPA